MTYSSTVRCGAQSNIETTQIYKTSIPVFIVVCIVLLLSLAHSIACGIWDLGGGLNARHVWDLGSYKPSASYPLAMAALIALERGTR